MSRFVKVYYSAGMCGTNEDINDYFCEYVKGYCESYGIEDEEDVEMELDYCWEATSEDDIPAGEHWQKA